MTKQKTKTKIGNIQLQTKRYKMKKFKITNTATNETREFGVPDNATDQEYDAMKEIVIAGLQGNNEIGNIKIELIDAPDEIKERYIINPDCDG